MSERFGRRTGGSGNGRRFGFEAVEIVVGRCFGGWFWYGEGCAADHSQNKRPDAADGEEADERSDDDAGVARFPPGVLGGGFGAAGWREAGDVFVDGVVRPRSSLLAARDVGAIGDIEGGVVGQPA